MRVAKYSDSIYNGRHHSVVVYIIHIILSHILVVLLHLHLIRYKLHVFGLEQLASQHNTTG